MSTCSHHLQLLLSGLKSRSYLSFTPVIAAETHRPGARQQHLYSGMHRVLQDLPFRMCTHRCPFSCIFRMTDDATFH